MRKIYLDTLTRKKDETGISYERISTRIEQKRNVSLSVSKLQRIFTGQQEPSVLDFEMIIEDGLEMDLMSVYAKMGRQEFKDSEQVDYKGAKELIADFNTEKAQIREEYETRIAQSIKAREETQLSFNLALAQIGDQYQKNAEYLNGIITDNEAYIRDLLAQTEKANSIAEAAQKRAEEAEKSRNDIDGRRHQVFWGMLSVILVLLGIIIASFILNIPAIGWGNF